MTVAAFAKAADGRYSARAYDSVRPMNNAYLRGTQSSLRENMRRYIALAALLVVLLVPAAASATDVTDHETIDVGDVYQTPILFLSEGKSLKVTVTSDKNIDVYITNSMVYDANITALYSKLNTKSTSFTWKNPEIGTYFLVVDNANNTNIPGSANPTGPAIVTVVHSEPFGEAVEQAALFAGMMCIAIVVVVVIIVVVIIVVIYMLVKKKKEPAAAPPPQPYAQPPYQPPPGQPQPPMQPPGQYAPPPPPPGQYQPPPPPPAP